MANDFNILDTPAASVSGAAIVASSHPTVSPGVVNTTTETAIASFSITAGTVIAGDRLIFEAAWDGLNNSGSAVTYTYRLKIGSTTYATPALSLGASSARWGGTAQFSITVPTLTTSRASGWFTGSFAGTSGFGGINSGHSGVIQSTTPTADFAGAVVVELTCQMGTAALTADFRPASASVTRMRAAA